MTQNNRERLRQAQAAAAKQQRLTRIIGVGAALLVLVVVGVFIGVMLQNQGKVADSSTITPPNATPDGKSIVVSPGTAKAGAPVVELFFDYQCPVCKQFEQYFGGTLTSLAASGDIDLRYRTMTFLDSNLGNDASVRAGVAATCADVAGKYADFHIKVFENQPATEGDGYADAVLRDTIPSEVGITGDALTSFQSCYDKQATKAFVNTSNELGQQDMLSVNKKVATPTIHVNGKDLPLSDIANVDPTKLLDLFTQYA
nr:thioredoxin domain-containing protein [Propionicimonas sp.]